MNDFKIPKKFLSISDFSKLSGISRKNLIYYDNIGILKPAFVKGNGYRYYLYNQLDDVSIILALKDLRIPLKEIKRYIENMSSDNLINLLASQKKKVIEEINRLKQIKFIIEKRTSNIPEILGIDCNKIFLENSRKELLFLGPDMQIEDENFEEDLYNFLDYAMRKKLLYGYPFGIYVNYHNLAFNVGTYKYFYKISKDIGLEEKTVKASGLYVISYDNSYLAEGIKNVDKLNEFMEKNQLIPTGEVYIENIADEMITKSQDKYLSKISIQVSKKRH